MKQKIIGILIIVISVSIYWFGNMSKLKKVDAIEEWQKLEILIRDGKVDKRIAKQELKKVKLLIDKYCEKQKGSKKDLDNTWIFPLEGYDYKSISGKDGDGFKPEIIYGPYGVKGYNFYDGNRHGGHPAHDIFIKDKNQDGLDDRTGLAVNVLSVKDCLVLSINTGWYKESNLRGGNYVWCYDYMEEKFIYYAHLDKIFVRPGEFIKKGEKIGTVGRTGVLADRKTSPTHLDLMVLDYADGNMVPYNFYKDIVTIRKEK